MRRSLLDRGANINTNWSTHQRASILREYAVRGKYEAAQFVLDQSIDMTTRDDLIGLWLEAERLRLLPQATYFPACRTQNGRHTPLDK